MARRNKKGNLGTARNLQAAGVKLITLGVVLLLLPLLLGSSPIGAALRSIGASGWFVLAVGGVLLGIGYVIGRRRTQDSPALKVAPRETRGRRTEPSPSRQASSPPVPPGDRDAPRPMPLARPDSWSRTVFDTIEWRRFEAVVEKLMQQGGFQTRAQSHGADGGVDIWVLSRQDPNTPISLVQCKHWQDKRVGVDKMRELRGVMAAQKVHNGQFATTSTFTEDAIEFARANGIGLLDVDALLELIGRRTPQQQAELLAVALDGEYWKPTCVNCGVKMTERAPRAGGSWFWGCVNFPGCRTTLGMRARAD
ncbi:type II restriction endonuclease zinc finger [Pseudorhodoferax aquiterrae]|uniref:Type II restriction endonuclease zinc finger n=1 Tax=Pseudorhodoferax aquiterrae TaxID=747304 RepID=A0ABQ3GHM2_9BURK|nr:restriction endonuclease [Pseudorhodoferax aquiterrae]GHD04647.1 type II restriction endonuclease zinc finger [Pseudorhodoferax aquiterrae]